MWGVARIISPGVISEGDLGTFSLSPVVTKRVFLRVFGRWCGVGSGGLGDLLGCYLQCLGSEIYPNRWCGESCHIVWATTDISQRWEISGRRCGGRMWLPFMVYCGGDFISGDCGGGTCFHLNGSVVGIYAGELGRGGWQELGCQLRNHSGFSTR